MRLNCVPIRWSNPYFNKLMVPSDVLGTDSDINIYVYDRSNHEAFLGHVRISPNLSEHNTRLEGWYKLQRRNPREDHVSGEIFLNVHFRKTDKRQYGPEDFQILKLIGRGEFVIEYFLRYLILRQVHLARSTRFGKRIPSGFMQ